MSSCSAPQSWSHTSTQRLTCCLQRPKITRGTSAAMGEARTATCPLITDASTALVGPGALASCSASPKAATHSLPSPSHDSVAVARHTEQLRAKCRAGSTQQQRPSPQAAPALGSAAAMRSSLGSGSDTGHGAVVTAAQGVLLCCQVCFDTSPASPTDPISPQHINPPHKAVVPAPQGVGRRPPFHCCPDKGVFLPHPAARTGAQLTQCQGCPNTPPGKIGCGKKGPSVRGKVLLPGGQRGPVLADSTAC